jgi:hypothetical protein
MKSSHQEVALKSSNFLERNIGIKLSTQMFPKAMMTKEDFFFSHFQVIMKSHLNSWRECAQDEKMKNSFY